MKSTFRLCVLWCLLLSAAGAVSLTGQEAAPGVAITRVDISHVGPPAVSDDLIRANIRLRPGDTYTAQSTDDDVQGLRSTGYFYDVRVKAEPDGAGVRVIYVLEGKPVLAEIRFEGNRKYSTKKLLKKVTSKIGEPLDEYKLYAAKQEIEKLYQKAGYQRTKVELNVVPNVNVGRGTATFVVKEAPKVRVTDVQFSGAQAFKQRKLRSVLKTRRFWMFSWLTGGGRLKDEQFEEDKQKLIEFYQDAGYIDFEIRDIKFLEPEPDRMVIEFDVFEGRQYKVGKVEFKGTQAFTEAAIRRGVNVLGVPVRMRMTEGTTFTPKGLDKDREAIEDFYGARGYIGKGDRDRIGVRAIKNPNVESGTMDLVYQVEEGEPSRIERIEIRGNTKTRDRVIRRELAVSPGEIFNMVKVKVSKERLNGLTFFSKVETDVDPTEDVPNAKNLIVTVEEGQSGNVYMGAGFSSVENIFGYVGMTQGNFDLANPPLFTGGGQKLRLELTIGSRQQKVDMKFVEPWFLGRRLMFELDAYHRNLRYLSDVYDQTETGARIGLLKELYPGLRGGISYTIESLGIDFKDSTTRPQVVVTPLPNGGREVTVIAPDISPEMAREEGDWLISKAGLTLALDRRGPGLLPNRGHREEISVTMGGSALGGDTDFYKWEFETAWYFKGFATGHVLELVGKTAVVEPFAGSDYTHIWDRNYLGGAYTLRGYKYRDISPRDTAGQPIGGNTSWMASAEYSIPVIERVRLAAFYDAGCVNADAYDFGTRNFADDWGVGLRISIPQMGPLRLDYAFPITYPDYSIHTPDRDKSGIKGKPRFQFSVGWSRQY